MRIRSDDVMTALQTISDICAQGSFTGACFHCVTTGERNDVLQNIQRYAIRLLIGLMNVKGSRIQVIKTISPLIVMSYP